MTSCIVNIRKSVFKILSIGKIISWVDECLMRTVRVWFGVFNGDIERTIEQITLNRRESTRRCPTDDERRSTKIDRSIVNRITLKYFVIMLWVDGYDMGRRECKLVGEISRDIISFGRELVSGVCTVHIDSRRSISLIIRLARPTTRGLHTKRSNFVKDGLGDKSGTSRRLHRYHVMHENDDSYESVISLVRVARSPPGDATISFATSVHCSCIPFERLRDCWTSKIDDNTSLFCRGFGITQEMTGGSRPCPPQEESRPIPITTHTHTHTHTLQNKATRINFNWFPLAETLRISWTTLRDEIDWTLTFSNEINTEMWDCVYVIAARRITGRPRWLPADREVDNSTLICSNRAR